MISLRGVTPILSSLLGGFLASGPAAQAASVGLNKLQAHQQQQTSILPPLHGNIPVNVPNFSNQGLINFWLKNEFSPILRNAAIQTQLCEAVTQARDINPDRFDRNHPIIGRLLRDPEFFNKALSAYNSHPSR